MTSLLTHLGLILTVASGCTIMKKSGIAALEVTPYHEEANSGVNAEADEDLEASVQTLIGEWTQK